MTKAVIYETATGKILRTINAPQSVLAYQCQAGESFLIGDGGDHTHRITQGELASRPLLSSIASWNKTTLTANGVDSATLSGIPNGAEYRIEVPEDATEVAEGVISGGNLVFKTDTPGSYTVTIRSFPYQLYSQVITAT